MAPYAGQDGLDPSLTRQDIMADTAPADSETRGKWMALTAALLGWMFDGLEMGLFPLVGRQALGDLLGVSLESATGKAEVGRWFGVMIAVFLVGAATGGVLFGWLGDRIGRVRAMMLSVATYAIFTGACSLITDVWGLAILRFIAALGMGGEWSLGVALVNEIWPTRSRAFLAGLIGAAANVGFLLIGVVGLLLPSQPGAMEAWLRSVGLGDDLAVILGRGNGWRVMMLCGALPALLTWFIRLFVPESEKWEREKDRGGTSHWATQDLLGVLVGAGGACVIILLWAVPLALEVQIGGSVLGLGVATAGYLYPVLRYLQRASAGSLEASTREWKPTLGRMLLGAVLSGVALLGTWGSVQWAPSWADQLTQGRMQAREFTQILSAIGAIAGTILAALMGDWFGRRPAYALLCVASLVSALVFFQGNAEYGPTFLLGVFFLGALTASFYGWLPLYLPELFRTAVRATGQGFSFNFGRIIAAVGSLQTGALIGLLGGSYPAACSMMSGIYIVGFLVIWLAPETRGKPLPE